VLNSGPASLARPSDPARAPCERDEATYDRHAAGLYRQALLTLDDRGLAEQVVSDVIVAECVRPAAPASGDSAPASGDCAAPASGDDERYRLAVAAYRRCQELASGREWHSRGSSQRLAGSLPGCIDPGGLSSTERGALGLVISSTRLAALLRAVLHKLAVLSPDQGQARSAG
jgi:hypothetical protein